MSPLDFVNFSDENSMAFQHIDDALRANVSQVMRRAEYILRSKIDLPRARCESAQEAMLRCLPGVGPETARAMVAAGIRPKLQGGIRLSREAEHAGEAFLLDDLMKVPGIGKKKAEKILAAIQK